MSYICTTNRKTPLGAKLTGLSIAVFLTAACATSTNLTRNNYVAVPQDQTALSFWLDDYGFPAAFDTVLQRRENGGTASLIEHRHDGHIAYLQHYTTVGRYFWGTNGRNDTRAGRAANLLGLERVRFTERLTVPSPIGNVNVGIFPYNDSHGCLYAKQTRRNIKGGAQDQMEAVFCKPGTLSATEARQVMAGVGMGLRQPPQALKPTTTAHQSMPFAGEITQVYAGSMNWGTTTASITNFTVLADRSFSPLAVTINGTRCQGDFGTLPGRPYDSEVRDRWSLTCSDGRSAFGRFEETADGTLMLTGNDRSLEPITAQMQLTETRAATGSAKPDPFPQTIGRDPRPFLQWRDPT